MGAGNLSAPISAVVNDYIVRHSIVAACLGRRCHCAISLPPADYRKILGATVGNEHHFISDSLLRRKKPFVNAISYF